MNSVILTANAAPMKPEADKLEMRVEERENRGERLEILGRDVEKVITKKCQRPGFGER